MVPGILNESCLGDLCSVYGGGGDKRLGEERRDL